MNTNMSVVYITNTGHVIGAVTCNSNASRTLAVTDVATPSYLVTSSGAPGTLLKFAIPAPALSLTPPLTFSHTVFSTPANFAVSGSNIQPLSTPFPPANKPALSATFITVHIPGVVGTDTAVFVQIQQESPAIPPAEICVLAGKVPAGSTNANLPLTILPGGASVSLPTGFTYRIALFVGGYQPFFESQAL